MLFRPLLVAALLGLLGQLPGPNELALPNHPEALRFAVMGDTGTGGRRQLEVGARMLEYHDRFPFELTLMLGDNLYGSEEPKDYERKFERPYAGLLARGVTFRAVLGNHDEPSQRFYEGFNMGGQRYYTFAEPRQSVRFFGIDSTLVDERQLEWLEEALRTSDETWKVAFFHHPIYSSGERHGSDLELREVLEPLFLAHGVNVVFAGHEHFYERLHPQSGITYITSGAGAKLRRGNVKRDSTLTAQRFDGDYSFMLLELKGDALRYQTISRAGRTVDVGLIRHPDSPEASGAAAPDPVEHPSVEIM